MIWVIPSIKHKLQNFDDLRKQVIGAGTRNATTVH